MTSEYEEQLLIKKIVKNPTDKRVDDFVSLYDDEDNHVCRGWFKFLITQLVKEAKKSSIKKWQ